MVAGDQTPAQAKPYSWDDTMPPPSETLRLWTEVGNGLDKSQTVVWKSAVESLDQANKFLMTSGDARYFVEKYMAPIISILVEQLPTKIGPHERNCVQESLTLAVIIVAKDLGIQLARSGQCHVLDVLSLVFNKKKAYYKGNKGSWNVNHLSGLPEVRLQMIERFRLEKGFSLLQTYLIERVNTQQFPSLELLHQILAAIADAVPSRPPVADHAAQIKEMEDDAIAVSKAVMFFIDSTSDDTLKKLSSDQLQGVRYQLRRIFDRLISSRRENSYGFYEFWRSLTLKLITSQSLPLKLLGWEEVNDLIDACAEHRPPPRSFAVSGAGCGFVNGQYSFAGATTKDGYAQRQVEISYERRIPDTAEEGAGKKLTLFRCTMRSQQKWWFLSEADEEQPGTDRDIDYYQHKSKPHEETEPPAQGWVTCRNAGVDPPPTLQAIGRMVPPGEELNTLEHQLAKWAIVNKIIELVLGDSVHREVVARSTHLIKFLASMCERDHPTESEIKGQLPNAYCLQTSHLLLAWKTCTKKADAAVAAQVYQLLVSILPSLPARLAIPLLEEVQTSLRQSTETRHYLNEVAEFCNALASSNPVDMKSGGVTVLGDDVRAEVLELLWAVLTHPDASTLKSYDSLKRYVTTELRVEPRGSAHRERFLRSCEKALTLNSKERSGSSNCDEVQALRMVKLTLFVLEACPREQTEKFLTDNRGALPILLFSELTAYMERRKSSMNSKKAGHSPESNAENVMPLAERLRILRYAYGISEQTTMSSPQLHNLWKLCDQPAEREELMIFIASASGSGPSSRLIDSLASALAANNSHPHTTNVLSPVISEEVCCLAFLDLFCSQSISYELLGEGAYTSFQFLFKKLRQAPETLRGLGGPALDALWRICLKVENDVVAAQAMKDLLAVYVSMAVGNRNSNGWVGSNVAGERMDTDDEEDEKFEKRVFDYLVGVKEGLEANDSSAERSAERCLRILNAAIGQYGSTGRLIPSSTTKRLMSLPQDASLLDALKCLPHGMRGQASYRRIGVLAKRTVVHNQQASQGYGTREDTSTTSSQARSSTHRFSFDVHPLETLASIKIKVANHCKCPLAAVKPISVSGRVTSTNTRSSPTDSSQVPLNVVSEECIVDELGVMQGCEMVFVISDRQLSAVPAASPKSSRTSATLDLSDIFFNTEDAFADRLFQMLLGVLDALPWPQSLMETDSSRHVIETHKLIWDLLQAMPTNSPVSSRVQVAADAIIGGRAAGNDNVAMAVDSPKQWPALLELRHFHSSVYVLQVIDHLLQPATPEVWSILPTEQRTVLENELQSYALSFRQGFIESGGFDAVVRFFSASDGDEGMKQSKTRMGNAVALRILKCCLFGSRLSVSSESTTGSALDGTGTQLLQSLSDAEGLLMSLTAMVIADSGISTSTIADVLKFLRLLFCSPQTAKSFVALQSSMAEKFLVTLLLWEGGSDVTRSGSNIGAASKVRKSAHDLILSTPILADHALQWLIRAIDSIDVSSESTSEYFDVLQKLVASDRGAATQPRKASDQELQDLGTGVCKKLASCPRPSSESSIFDISTGVLCCSLALLRALIEHGGGGVLREGTEELVRALGVTRWSEMMTDSNSQAFVGTLLSSWTQPEAEDITLIDLMGAIFDGFLCPGGSSSVVAICFDKESRQRGFDVVGAAARSCQGSDGYKALVARITEIVRTSSPFLRHRWGHNGSNSDGNSRSLRNPSKYSGLRNQGCTCYMNSVLQQLFMMHELRKVICHAPIPTCLRTSGGGVVSAKGAELVGKKLALQWESGVSYDAMVEAFDPHTGMHTIRYCKMQVATVGGGGHQQVHPDDIADLPPDLPDEFLLSEGRPGKETGVFEIITEELVPTGPEKQPNSLRSDGIEETDDEATSRHLLEEVQRTFIHLDEGSRGRCFDPRALVEACACLKLEFDVWQQNDASEFATKLLDRLEISLKRWAPSHCRYLDHTFGLKQTKQKICKECGLKTNREEKLMNIDCQIRGKADINEALATMTEVEIMEGNNKVFCDRCKMNTDTVLRTAISALPNVLILSLKRFDLDYNTFETVKLNSRCEFGQTLNMKKYTLEGLEELERAKASSPMDTGEDERPAPFKDSVVNLADDDYEYKLVGVLVHAGVAQGGHYYSFIKDRNPGVVTPLDKWYRFDDEDVTPFDPSSIETECFGGKVKKETKWPNGQVHTVENEQYANALMLFYEKVKPTDPPVEDDIPTELDKAKNDSLAEKTSGFDVFEPDVRRSNATHRWQTFLFDMEFQTFLKGLLGLCRLSGTDSDRMDIATPTSPRASMESENSWRLSVVHMLLTFVFDVLLYSAEKSSLNEWVKMIEQTMAGVRECARIFVRDLSKRTRTVSSNWLRTYLSDCPDQASRRAAVRIFNAAMRSCAWFEDEQVAISRWSQAWADLIAATFDRQDSRPMPTRLEGENHILEDVQELESGRASSLGVIISFLNELLEAAPRTWRYNPELCLLIRNLCNLSAEFGGDFVRDAMIKSLVPPRLICLVIRERAPRALRSAFPGSSVSIEAAETQARTETSTSPHVMSLSGNQVMNATDLGPRGVSPLPSDYLMLFEALGCLARLQGIIHAPLVFETDESSRGRPRVLLTDQAKRALGLIFEENGGSSDVGLGQRDIEIYLQRCGLEAIPPQKIADIMAKYPTAVGSNGGGSLSLEGFLAYYRDTAQTNETRVRSDLNTFGFRPDLSRRSDESRFFTTQGRPQYRTNAESVAIDVAMSLKSRGPPDLGRLADIGFQSFHLYVVAHSASEVLAEHLLAGVAYEKDTSHILLSTLRNVCQAPTGWAGNETWNTALVVLRLLASLPDSRQRERITFMMQCTEKPVPQAEHGAGLLVAARIFHDSRQGQHFSSEFHFAFDRYVAILKELLRVEKVFMWMSENRSSWSWMERELRDHHVIHLNQARTDYTPRRELENSSIPPDHHHSDSDMAGINDSEEDDDDDSRFEEIDGYKDNVQQVVVEGSGLPAINGVYERDGLFGGVGRYSKQGEFKNEKVLYVLFQCNVSNNTKHWYISIVPRNGQPGTNTDIDFYSVPVTDSSMDYPPSSGWTKAPEGKDPPPTVKLREQQQSSGETENSRGQRPIQVWNNTGSDAAEEEENNGRYYI